MEEADDREESRDDELEMGIPDVVRRRLEALVPELMRKTFSAGLGVLMTTEGGLRNIAKDLPLPKDLTNYLTTTAGGAKDEVMKVVAREVGEFLQTVNFSEEVAKMLTLLSLEVKTEIRFIPNEKKIAGVEPNMKSSIRLKKNKNSSGSGSCEENTDSEGRPKARRRRLTMRGRKTVVD